MDPEAGNADDDLFQGVQMEDLAVSDDDDEDDSQEAAEVDEAAAAAAEPGDAEQQMVPTDNHGEAAEGLVAARPLRANEGAVPQQLQIAPSAEGSNGPNRILRRMSFSSMDEFSQRNPVGAVEPPPAIGNPPQWQGDQSDNNNQAPTGSTLRYKKEGMADATLAMLERLRQEGQMIDVTLVAGNTHIPAHRAVLAASSPYFYAMFTGFQEKDKDKVNLIDVNPEALKTLLDYAYTTEVVVHEGNVQDLLATSDLLQMTDVKDACCEFLKMQLCPSNVIGFQSFADIHGCDSLVEDCQKFIDQNFQPVSEGEEFLKLRPDDILRILGSDRLNVSNEERVYESAMAWVNHDLKERRRHLPTVLEQVKDLEQVRLPLLSKEYLVDNIVEKFREDVDCAKFVIEAMKYHLVTDMEQPQKASLPSIKTRPRQPIGLPRLLLAIGGQAPKAIRSVEGFDFTQQKWLQVSEMQTRRCRCGVAVVKGRVYVVGGFNGSLRVRTVDEYNPADDSWTSAPSMDARRSTLGVAVWKDCIYAVGGFDGSMGLNTAEVLDLSVTIASRGVAGGGGRRPEWRSIASMVTRRSSVGVGVLGGQVYAVGGYDGNSRQCLQTVEVYEPEANCWKFVAEMSARRSGAAVGILNGFLYAVGGHDGPIVRQSVERYNPASDTWTTVADMNNCRRNAGIVTHNGSLYIIGGDDGSQNLTSMEVYNPTSDSWTELEANLTLGRSYTGVCVIDRPETCGAAWPSEADHAEHQRQGAAQPLAP